MKKYFLLIGVVVMILIGVISYNNKFAMTIKQETITTGDSRIAVEYALPQGGGEKPGLILFIHGDGPANKNGDQGYYPGWEVLAKENVISVTWDKAGVGDSTGNWLSQDMVDRKVEAEKVLEWALAEFDIDPNKVGVWGASQGGWVITKLLNENDKVKFAIGVAPAVNWLRQGKFNTSSEMAYEGYSSEEITERLVSAAKINEYLNADNYQGYLDSKLDQEVLEKERWDFIRKNMSLDNTEELKKITKPYYLLVGDHDLNVDTKETVTVYQSLIPKEFLTVKHIENGTHRMLKARHQKDNVMTVIESILNPRAIFAPQYLQALQELSQERL